QTRGRRRVRRLALHRRNVVARVDHGHWLADEIGGQRHQAVILVFSVLVVDRDVAALDKAYAAKALAKAAREPLRRYPTTGIVVCCARAANGHAAAPPSSVMNSRRSIFALIRSARLPSPFTGAAR